MGKYSLKVFAALEVLWIFTEGLGYMGLAFIGYSVTASYVYPWEWLEHVATLLSSFLTLFGTIVTVASIYFPQAEPRPAWWHSRYVIAPAVLTVCVAALYLWFAHGTLPPVAVNGFGLLAISGGLKRMIPKDIPGFSN